MEEEVMDNELGDVQKKENKFIKIFTIIAIVAFVFSLYLFFISSINLRENPAKEFEEQGAVFYTLNLANPLTVFGSIDPIILIIILAIVIVITLIMILILVYFKIRKVRKINIEKQNTTANLNLNSEQMGIQFPDKTYSFYNNKVLELLDEGNEFLNKKEYANARITYHKIRGWYNLHDDESKEIYLKILRFYERIVREEI